MGPWAKRHIGYVQQEDNLGAYNTVSETIRLVADLKLRNQNNERLVDRIMDGLNLSHISNSLIGS